MHTRRPNEYQIHSAITGTIKKIKFCVWNQSLSKETSGEIARHCSTLSFNLYHSMKDHLPEKETEIITIKTSVPNIEKRLNKAAWSSKY